MFIVLPSRDIMLFRLLSMDGYKFMLHKWTHTALEPTLENLISCDYLLISINTLRSIILSGHFLVPIEEHLEPSSISHFYLC